ncbi:MAG TPA: ABC transporter substrate-binding protein [Geobacteraceae bacterium]
MRIYRERREKIPIGCVAVRLIVFAAFFAAVAASAGEERQPGVGGLSREETLRRGEMIYRKGILPSGEPVTAFVQGDVPVEGTMFSCESCHMRSGFGSYEGGVVTTPTTGKYLYQPVYNVRQLTPAEKETVPRYFKAQFEAPPKRPAYTDETLAAALRSGIDPTGRTFNNVMPRYLLSDRDMAILIFYLNSLSAELSPGVTDTTVRFATVVTDDVSPAVRDALVKTLENYARGRNNMAENSETRSKRGFSADLMDMAYRRKLSISRWELKGAPETWRGQLEEYYRKEPVFALLGGVTNGEWWPVHEFSEEHHIPCVLPITDFPVISETDWYTVYFSKGFYQEGEAAARFLGITANLPPDKAVVQVFRDTRQGRAFSAGFEKAWHDLGRQPPVNRSLRAGEGITGEFLQQLADKDKASVVLLWVGSEAVPALETIAASTNRPEMVYVSSSLLKQNIWKLPEQARDFTYITYPYAYALRKAIYADAVHKSPQIDGFQVNDRRISTGTMSVWFILNDALMMLGTNFYRDRFLDVIGMIQDKGIPYTDYERLSFGPGQRYAAKGCYVMQLTHGPNPDLVKKSDWVIP